jgi:exosortase
VSEPPRAERIETALAFSFFLAVFHPFFGFDFGSERLPEIERFFFESGGTSPSLALGISAWLAWRRLPRLRGLPGAGAPAATAIFAGTAALVVVWSRLAAAPDLLALPIALLLLAFGCAARGIAGARALLLPAALLGLALPIPFPLQNEVVWQLQLWSAAGGEALLALAGFDVSRSGAHLLHGDVAFVVIDSCSGLRGLRTLVLVAFVLRELFARAGRRAWWLVAAAPPLAIALNMLRIAVIASDAARAAAAPEDTHIEQGLSVLFGGTIALFALGAWLERGRPEDPRAVVDAEGALPLRGACAVLAALALPVTALAPWRIPNPTVPALNAIPLERAGWTGRALDPDRRFLHGIFVGAAREWSFEREGRRGGEPRRVSLFVASEAAGSGRTSLRSRALLQPGADWETLASEPVRIWSLGVDATLADARSRDAYALVYGFGLHESSSAVDSLRSLFALERGPFERERARVRVRISTRMQDSAASRAHAKQILDRFVFDFGNELAAL